MSCKPADRRIYSSAVDSMANERYLLINQRAHENSLSKNEREKLKQTYAENSCVINFLNKYTELSENLRPSDEQIDELHQLTLKLADKAEVNHSNGHSTQISEGRTAWYTAEANSMYDPQCKPVSIMHKYNKFLRCNQERDKIDMSCNQNLDALRIRWDGLRIQKGLSDKGQGEKCVAEAKAACEQLEYPKHIPFTGELRQCFRSLSPGISKTGENFGHAILDADEIIHFHLDKVLGELASSQASTRLDKRTDIEKFVSLVHHGGSALDFACDNENVMLTALTSDVLDCLLGADWDKVCNE